MWPVQKWKRHMEMFAAVDLYQKYVFVERDVYWYPEVGLQDKKLATV